MAADHTTAIFVAELILLLFFGRMLGEMMNRLGQPAIFGQLLAGVLLGPSVFGALMPELRQVVFPGTPALKSIPALAARQIERQEAWSEGCPHLAAAGSGSSLVMTDQRAMTARREKPGSLPRSVDLSEPGETPAESPHRVQRPCDTNARSRARVPA